MTTAVGVHELRRHLSEYLRRVGESFAVTSRGCEVAVLGPVRAER